MNAHIAASRYEELWGYLMGLGVIAAEHLLPEEKAQQQETLQQLDFFTDFEAQERQRQEEEKRSAQEKKLQQAMLHIKTRYGKNAILKGTNFEEGATAIERNGSVGGHRA